MAIPKHSGTRRSSPEPRTSAKVSNARPHAPAPRPDDSSSALKLIGAVSHEMRNPLNGILGMSHLLSETQLDSAQRNYLDGITSSGEVLLTLVNDLLDLTALQNGAIAPSLEPTDLPQLIHQCVELAAPRAHAKNLAIGSYIDAVLAAWQDAPVLVEVDGARVRQVLTNLLSNAIKFTDTGGVSLSVHAVAASALGGLDAYAPDQSRSALTHLVFDVRDTGHGIAAADQALVFEPFGRTKTAQIASIEGTGLGLPLSKGLARAMGGDLMLAHSEPGAGTMMRFTLPFTLSNETGPAAGASPDDLPLVGHRVLLVLDPLVAASPEADVLAATLHALGADVRTVSASEALNGTPENVDHVLVDAAFDHAMLWARLCLPQVGLRPVVLLRPDDRHQLADLRDAGFWGYLIRPVRQASLVAMLNHRFDEAGAEPFLADPADVESLAPPSTGQRILIADDNQVNARLAQAALERAGHKVAVVGDGARMVAQAAQAERDDEPFQLVLLDLAMPVLDGFAAARQLRDTGYTGRLIAYSGNTDASLPDRLKQAGFDGFAKKPLAPTALQALVDDGSVSM